MQCHLCSSQGHHWTKCPLFGKPEEFIQAFAPAPLAPPEAEVLAKRRTSLAPSLEELFGRDKDRMLAEAADDPSTPPEEKLLALELLIGTKKLGALGAEDQELAANINHRLIFGTQRVPIAETPAKKRPSPRQTVPGDDPYSSVNFDYDRDPQNEPA